MTPHIFDLGDEVEIIGPSQYSGILSEHLGQIFKIDQIWRRRGQDIVTYSSDGMPWYPVSSLRLVEELKIGDWVEIIKPGLPDYTGQIGKIIRVDNLGHDGYPNQLEDKSWWSNKCLRKLTPEEIEQHISKAEVSPESKIWEKINWFEDRLSAIEKRLGESEKWQDEAHDMITDRLCALEEWHGRIRNAFQEAST